jgi:hypothetical protein
MQFSHADAAADNDPIDDATGTNGTIDTSTAQDQQVALPLLSASSVSVHMSLPSSTSCVEKEMARQLSVLRQQSIKRLQLASARLVRSSDATNSTNNIAATAAVRGTCGNGSGSKHADLATQEDEYEIWGVDQGKGGGTELEGAMEGGGATAGNGDTEGDDCEQKGQEEEAVDIKRRERIKEISGHSWWEEEKVQELGEDGFELHPHAHSRTSAGDGGGEILFNEGGNNRNTGEKDALKRSFFGVGFAASTILGALHRTHIGEVVGSGQAVEASLEATMAAKKEATSQYRNMKTYRERLTNGHTVLQAIRKVESPEHKRQRYHWKAHDGRQPQSHTTSPHHTITAATSPHHTITAPRDPVRNETVLEIRLLLPPGTAPGDYALSITTTTTIPMHGKRSFGFSALPCP